DIVVETYAFLFEDRECRFAGFQINAGRTVRVVSVACGTISPASIPLAASEFRCTKTKRPTQIRVFRAARSNGIHSAPVAKDTARTPEAEEILSGRRACEPKSKTLRTQLRVKPSQNLCSQDDRWKPQEKISTRSCF